MHLVTLDFPYLLSANSKANKAKQQLKLTLGLTVIGFNASGSDHIQHETYIEDLEAGNVEHTDEAMTLLLGVQGEVDLLDQPLEETVEHGLSHGTNRVVDLDGGEGDE